MRLLVTRPREDSEALAAQLRAAGHEVVIDPLLHIEPVDPGPIECEDVQAILATSRHALEGLVRHVSLEAIRNLPVIAVGGATAREAHDLGFTQVSAGSGGAAELLPTILDRCAPGKGVVLQPSAEEIAVDLTADLVAAGIELRRVVVYRSVAANSLATETNAALADGTIEAVILLSARTASAFATLAGEAIRRRCKPLPAFCLSTSVARPLAGLPGIALRVSSRPGTQELLALIEREATQSMRG